MKEKFPFGIDGITLFDSEESFLKIHNLDKQMLALINGSLFISEKKKVIPKISKKGLRDHFEAYYSQKSIEHPNIVFFKLRLFNINLQYGDKKRAMYHLEKAYEAHPNHYMTKLYLAFEYVLLGNFKKAYEALNIKNTEKEITSIKDIFPEIKEMMSSEYIRFLFVVVSIYNFKVSVFDSMGDEKQKKACIDKMYEFTGTMNFIDANHKLTLEVHKFLNTHYS